MDADIEARFRDGLGKRIRRARRTAELRQGDLAATLRVDQGRVSLWEHGRVVPGVLQLVEIALTCRTRPEALLEGIIAPSLEQQRLKLDARSLDLLNELTALIVDARGAPGEPAEGPSADTPSG